MFTRAVRWGRIYLTTTTMFARLAIIVAFLLHFHVAFAGSGYSIGLASKDGGSKNVSVYILVNEVEAFDEEEIGISPVGMVWYNFMASPGDSIEVRVDNSAGAENDHHFYYLINNGPDGGRTNIYDSSSDNFYPRNRCNTSDGVGCTFNLDNMVTHPWGLNRANVLVNDIEQISGFDGTVSVPFYAKEGDVIRIEHYVDDLLKSATTDADISCTINLSYNSGELDYIEWIVGYFGSAAMIPNPFSQVEIEIPASSITIPAGSDLSVKLTSSPSAVSYLVQLKCEGFSVVEIYINSNVDAQPVTIPSDLYGEECVLSVEEPIEGLNTRTVTVTQPVTISTSPVDITVFRVNSVVPILIESGATNSTLLTLVRTCGTDVYNYPTQIPVGTVYDASLPVDFIGLCTFSTLVNGVYQASDIGLTVRIKNELMIELNTDAITDGQYFEISVSSAIPPYPEYLLVNLELLCSGSGLSQRIPGIELNQRVKLKALLYISQPSICTLTTFGSDDVYIQATASTIVNLQNLPSVFGILRIIHPDHYPMILQAFAGLKFNQN